MSLLRQLLDADGKSMADVRASIQHLAGTSSLEFPFFEGSWGGATSGFRALGLGWTTKLCPVVSFTASANWPISLIAIVEGQLGS